MLSNGATVDVVAFAAETLRDIEQAVYDAIYEGSNTDQAQITRLHGLKYDSATNINIVAQKLKHQRAKRNVSANKFSPSDGEMS